MDGIEGIQSDVEIILWPKPPIIIIIKRDEMNEKVC